MGEPTAEDIARNWRAIRAKVDQAARLAGRDPAGVGIVAVSKTKPAWMVRAALAAGATVFGENYVQEALAKEQEVGPGPQWHLVGSLQTNKAKDVVGRFALLHAVDSEKLLRELDRRAGLAGVANVEVLLEVNLAGEATKAGVAPEEALPLLRQAASLPRIKVRGLMAMPPVADGPANRPHFARLRELSQTPPVRERLSPPVELSMGTSADFESAIAEGATLIRVGTAIFGPRQVRERP
jgi:PLP dependent protein